MRNSLISKILTLSFVFAFVACADIDGKTTEQNDFDGGSNVIDAGTNDETMTISAQVLEVITVNGVEKARAFVTVTSSVAPEFVSIQCNAPAAPEFTGNTFSGLGITQNTANQRTGFTEFTVQPNIRGYNCKAMAGFGNKLISTVLSSFDTPPLNTPPQPINSISAVCVPVGATSIDCTYLASFTPSTLWVQAYTPQELSLSQYHTAVGTVMATTGTVHVVGLAALTDYTVDVVATISGSQQQYKASMQVKTQASTGVIPADAASITLDTTDVTVQAGSIVSVSGGFTNATQITCVNQIDRSVLPVVLGVDQWFTSLKVDATAVVVCIAFNSANKPTNPVTKKFIVPSVTADTVAPNFSNVQPPMNSVVTTPFVTVTGAIADQNGVTKMTATGVSPVQSFAVSLYGTAPNQTFSFVVPAGNNAYTIIAQDASGNTAVYNEILTAQVVGDPLIVDPTIALISTDLTVSSGSFQEVKGTSLNGVQVKCQNRVDGSLLVVQGMSSWSATVQVNKTVQIGCVAVNVVGKSSAPVIVTFTVPSITADTTAPVISNVQPASDSTVTTATTLITGAIFESGVLKVTVTNVSTSQVYPVSLGGVAPNQTFSVLVATPASSNSFSIAAQDASGNTSVYNEVIKNSSPVTGGGVIITPPPAPTGNFTMSCNNASSSFGVYVLNPSMPLIDSNGTHFNESQPGQSIVIPAATFCGGSMFDSNSNRNEVFEAICVNRSNNTWTSQGLTVTRPDGTVVPLRTGLNNGNNLMATPTDLGCANITPGNGGGTTGLVPVPNNAVLNPNGGIVVTPAVAQSALQLFAGALTDGTISAVSFSPQTVSNTKLEVANDLNFTAITKTVTGTNGTTSQFVVPAQTVNAPTTVYLRATGTDSAGHQIQSGAVSVVYYPFAVGFNRRPDSLTAIYATGKFMLVDLAGTAVAVKTHANGGADIEPVWVAGIISLTKEDVCMGANINNTNQTAIRLMAAAKSGLENLRLYLPNGELYMVGNSPILPIVADPNYRNSYGWTWGEVDSKVCGG